MNVNWEEVAKGDQAQPKPASPSGDTSKTPPAAYPKFPEQKEAKPYK